MRIARACLSLAAGLLNLVLTASVGLAAGSAPGPTTTPPVAANGVAAAVVASSASISTPLGVPGNWSLLFEDNFDTLNRSVWTPYWFKDCAGSMVNKVLTCSSNVSVTGGELTLQMSGPDKGALVATNPSDGVAGHVGASFGLGFYEARILFPGTCGTTIHNWPAWWTTGQSWPAHGENDIAEPLSGTMHSNYHSPSKNTTASIPGCWAGQFHTYGLHRKAGRNDVYFDGALVQSYATLDGAVPHYLVINVGYWSGSQVSGPAGAVRVDYVRVWRQG
ncbi:family 16 glycosylhydrolase [Arthrobacter liuii]|uniref:GH16 domain-containing protein n=1 Tax=Arthrobacter liuii TaxID=1476996 RepID=A0ABQ2AUK3_9MICC|nr:family 16 glycosylhydrolase [Arthrobacter liuii]GGH95602.1 hypothetical protein GCM10007170_21510 [Arthrobacter liuii]